MRSTDLLGSETDLYRKTRQESFDIDKKYPKMFKMIDQDAKQSFIKSKIPNLGETRSKIRKKAILKSVTEFSRPSRNYSHCTAPNFEIHKNHGQSKLSMVDISVTDE